MYSAEELDLLESAHRGDPVAFRVLYDHYRRIAVNVAYRTITTRSPSTREPREAAKDVVQNAWADLLTQIKKIEPKMVLVAFFRLVKIGALNFSWRQEGIGSYARKQHETYDPEGDERSVTLIHSAMTDRAAKAACLLPDDQFDVFVMSVMGKSREQIAEEMGESKDVINSRLARARRTLYNAGILKPVLVCSDT